MLLNPYMMSTTTTTCPSARCPSQVHTLKSTTVILPQPTSHTNEKEVFSASLNLWLYPQDSQCGRKFTTKPSEKVSFYEDVTLNENGDAHKSWHCADIRVSSPRTMLNLKSFVIFSADLLSRGELLSCPTHHCQFPSLEEIFPCLEQHFGMVVTTFAFSVQIMAGICMMV